MLVIGHRGAPTAFQENSLEGFLAADRAGANGVELDVRRTADGALAVHHDAVLPGGLPISNIGVDQLPISVPTLPDVFAALRPDLLVDVEIKTEPPWEADEAAASLVVDLVRRTGRHAATLVTSFNLATVDVVRAAGLRTGWLTLQGYDQSWALATAVEHGHSVLLPPFESVDEALVGAAHAQGVDVWTWTVDDPADFERMRAAGVDAVITNDPARFTGGAGPGNPARGEGSGG